MVNQNDRALFRIVGMYCVSCKPVVENQLKDVSGIKKIGVDYMTDSVVVDYDRALINKEEIKERLENSGYKFIRVAR